MRISAIAAMDETRVIGMNGKLPWHIPEDLKRFKDLTSGHSVLMGRKTWDSLPAAVRPLPNRHNIILTRQSNFSAPQAEVWGDLVKCLNFYKNPMLPQEFKLKSDKLWIIGGEQIYRETMPYWDELYLTVVNGSYQGDAFFPEVDHNFKLMAEEQFSGGVFRYFQRKPGQ